ncbi:MAG: alginate export family protein [Candidatus Zixiibacteriota bacterium]
MRQISICVFVFLLIFVSFEPVRSATELELSGQVRVRAEWDDREFDPELKWKQYNLLRTRLGLKAVIEDNTEVFAQFQDSRTFGDTTFAGQAASGGLNDGKNVDMHQAYLKINRLGSDDLSLQAGRFELNFGNQRVFGAVDWHNVGRAWEGMLTRFEFSNIVANGFVLKNLEVNADDGNRDFDIYGLYANFEGYNLDLFFFYENDANVSYVADVRDLKRYNIGLYYKRQCYQLDFELNGVYQFGTRALRQPATYNELDIAAFMFTFEAGYKFEGDAGVRLAAGVDYCSGDDDPLDRDFKAYSNAYYTGHKFRGYMDYFIQSDTAGLMDLMIRAKMAPAKDWVLNGDFHYFTRTADYVDFNYDETKDVGMEIDLTLSTTSVAGVVIDAGASLFLPKEAFAGMEDPDPGFWFYAALTANIPAMKL